MSAPAQIITRSLTFHFAPSVNTSTGLPEIMEVAVIPLGDASSAPAGGTFAGGLKTVTVELTSPGPNVVTFDLIPSYSPGLNAPILYRVMWRAGVMGRTYTHDFTMPDEDLTWEQLAGGGLVIDGEVYLQHSDLGVPGRVARLNDQGIPMNSAGNPVATGDDITAVKADLNVEVVNRAAADANLHATLEGEINSQVAATLNTAKVYADNKVSTVDAKLITETANRQSGDASLQTQLSAAATSLQNQFDTLEIAVGVNADTLGTKADLVGGKVSVAQIPDAALTTATPVPDQTAMLALTPAQVQRGDLAVRPDSVWLLNTNDPAQLSSWINLTNIYSVNGKRGTVVLTAADVGAIPTGGSVAMVQVTGLNTALLGKTDTSATTALQGQVTALANDPTTVHTVGGTIPLSPMPPEIALVNGAGQVTNKAGQVVAAGGPGGAGAVLSVNSKTGNVVLTLNDVGGSGQIAQARVTGLDTALAGKAAINDTRLSDARTPTSHAASHGAGQADAVTVAQSQVSGLSTILTNNSLTGTSNFGNRINALEASPPGGGTSSPVKSTWWDSPSATTDFSLVNIKSPFGKAASDGHLYYDPAGAAEAEAVYPYITPNGHLELRKRNEAAAPDPALATQTALDATNVTVSAKASQASLTALSTTVDGKASQGDLNATNSVLANKADQSAVSALSSTVASKANQADLAALTVTVNGKAAQADLTTLTGTVNTNAAALATKADLVGGTVPVAQVPVLPQAKITGLSTTLSGKADLDGSAHIMLAQLPTNIPITSVQSLTPALAAKADLVGGKVLVSQIPPEAITSSVTVANRAAMLALTSVQVQPGDFCIITSTSDIGSYLLKDPDPSQFANWQPLSGAAAPVQSVNGQNGTVVLVAADVGALAANASIPIAQVSSLQVQLDTKATTTALTAGLAPKATYADVQTMFYTSSMVKRADYVATAAIASLAGQQSADGVLMPLGAIVLATAQSSSVNNGLWVVASGAWTRPADFAVGSYLSRDSVVIVSNQTGSASGAVNLNTIWQMTANSGFISTDVNNWTRIGWTSPPFAPVQGNGVSITGTYPALTIAAKVDPGKGLINTATGLATDTNKTPGKFLGSVPAGSTVAAITHNLNSTSPVVQLWDVASNTMVLAGVTVTSANAISIEFANAPASNQYRVVILA